MIAILSIIPVPVRTIVEESFDENVIQNGFQRFLVDIRGYSVHFEEFCGAAAVELDENGFALLVDSEIPRDIA